MKLLIFDIDGTLTDTNAIDDKLYRAAVRAVLPVAVDEPLPAFADSTDSAILDQLHDVYPTDDFDQTEAEIQRLFFAALIEAFEEDLTHCLPIPGATSVFEAARAGGWSVAIATGGWRESARTKLSFAGIPVDGTPLASASDFRWRPDIIRHAMRLTVGDAEPTEVVYVGDAPWDVRACIELGIGFIGRSAPAGESRLRELGATAVLPDFEDASALLRLLEEPATLVP